MKFIPANAQHIGSREAQQDSFGFSDPFDEQFVRHGGFVAVLADGMGGLEHGGLAGRAAVKAFLSVYQVKTEAESIPEALERALLAANAAVWTVGKQTESAQGTGATLVAAAFGPDGLHWVSVGDSAIYFYRGGQLSKLNQSHNYARELDAAVASGRLSSEQALRDPDRESLTSYLGLARLTEVDQSPQPIPLEPGDRVALASDGLFKSLSDAEIAAELGRDPQEGCETLVQRTLAKRVEHQDNVTVLCVGVGSEQRAAATVRLASRRPDSPAPVVTRSRRTSLWVAALCLALAATAAAGVWWRVHNRAAARTAERGEKNKISQDIQKTLESNPHLPGAALEFVKIPAGEFMMGSENGAPNEKPVHRVRITKGFEMSTYEVTQAQWKAVMGAALNPDTRPGADGYPVVGPTFLDAQRFVKALNAKSDGTTYRLPTEAEWEYAARAGSTGDSAEPLDQIAWCNNNCPPEATPQPASSNLNGVRNAMARMCPPMYAGGKRSNAWGLHDMQGNVWEWVEDWYDPEYYSKSPAEDPQGPSHGKQRVIRGGAANSSPQECRVSNRDSKAPNDSGFPAGFRVVRLPKPAALETRQRSSGERSSGAVLEAKEGPPGAALEFVKIPGGEFMMGSENGGPNEKPVHRVRITKAFEMSAYEVTQGQWKAVMGAFPHPQSPAATDDYPVNGPSFFDALHFVGALNLKHDGYNYRLPTEAEWEYACRAGTKEDQAGRLDDMGWYSGNCPVAVAPGSPGPPEKRCAPEMPGYKRPNAWRLYDMQGNVSEWVQDWYDENYYAKTSARDPAGPSNGTARVIRGGAFSSSAEECRCSARAFRPPDDSDFRSGFRVVRTPRQ